MPMPSKFVLLASGASGVNAPVSFDFDGSDIDFLLVEYVPDIAVPAPATGVEFFDRDHGTTNGFQLNSFTSPADALGHNATWGLGATLAGGGRSIGGLPAPIPRNPRVTVNALGVGVTATVRVYGRRNFRGPDVAASMD